ncbi:carotenoid biosynthesis protein [Silvibacterium sp.]|uniref:carotenoid biosynthesis protein n=1 Tax=Silvibacterium sp. TaxID=1964179 RepID=UPI0039E6BBAE
MLAHSLLFPGMPYGSAPRWAFAIAEICMLLLMVLCAVHAVRSKRRGALSYLLGGFLFGLALEYIEVLSGSYTYGRFHLMLGHAPKDIPICIGAGWGIILYTARLYSDALRLRPFAAAALDTLLALNIDLSMDVVAYRLHMWHWYWNGTGLDPLRAQWFGIPYGNFVGWATVVFCYSLYSRLWERRITQKPGAWRGPVVAVLALVCAQATLFVTETWIWDFLHRHAGLTSGPRLLLIVLAMATLIAWGWKRRESAMQPMDGIALWVPCWFHLYFFFCFAWFHFFRENRWMTAAAAANIVLGIGMHLLPLREQRRKQA